MLRSAYFDDFKSGPKVLFWGDGAEIAKLSGWLRAASSGQELLGLRSFTNAVDAKEIVIRPAAVSTGMRAKGAFLDWGLNSEAMLEFAGLIDGLAETDKPSHQYLETALTAK
jgi:hypothetical protein